MRYALEVREATCRWQFTQSEAMNTDCLGCLNCVGCTDCTGCEDCADCLGCTGCFNCVDCVDCLGRKFCIENKQFSKEGYLDKVKQ